MSTRTAQALGGATLGAIIESGTRLLEQAGVSFGHGTSNARDEAVWLALWSLKLPLDTPLDDSANSGASTSIAPAQLAQVATLFEERIRSRKPAAYLTREAWLQGVSFYVDERSIVPRSLLAELVVDGSIDAFLTDATHDVLDLCTGNGSLAVLAAMAWPDVQVTAADLSNKALEVAAINVKRHGLQDRITLVPSDSLAAVPGPWDLIICNPPYVNHASMQLLPQEYQAEPAMALAGGNDGMDFIRRLLTNAGGALRDDGVLLLEIGNERSHFEAAFPALPVFWLATSAGDDQVVLITQAALGRGSGTH